jgi:glyoxalase family protein
VFEQPNFDHAEQNHLYFDPGDGRLITVFTNESWKPGPTPNPTGICDLHHLAFAMSHATYTQAVARLKERGFPNSGEIDRGFMHSIYFRDPLGQLLELASYKSRRASGRCHRVAVAEAGAEQQKRSLN